MAKQTGFFKFTGRLGDVVGYSGRDGEFYLRSAAEHVRQTTATRVSARAFGKASKLAGAMRHAMSGQLDALADPDNVNRLNKALLEVLLADDLYRTKRFVPANFSRLKGFCFNQHTGLPKVLTVQPAVNHNVHGNILVTIPAMNGYITHPRATHLTVKAVAVHVAPGFNAATATSSDLELIPVDQPSAEITLVIPAGKGAVSCVLLEVGCCQQLHGRLYQLHDRQYTAADVIAVFGGRVRRNRPKRRKLQAIPPVETKHQHHPLPEHFEQRE